MIYRIHLKNANTGDATTIEVPARTMLESFSTKIKEEMGLPLKDNGWHRFLINGVAYVIDQHVWLEPDIREECEIPVERDYRNSEKIRLDEVFTVIGSAINYEQDQIYEGYHRIVCTLEDCFDERDVQEYDNEDYGFRY
ncbi:MAG: hypothetical protein K6E73_11740 [Bacteroidales bacterium]|nr:hypothetical protein [Bacteroidales bacterium]